MHKNFRIGVLASTNGTDLQAIIDEMKAGKMPGIELAVVLGNREKAFALERARDQGYRAVYVDPKNLSREEYDEKLAEILIEEEVDLVVLIGYMKILSSGFVNQFPGRIINVHPALMPKFSGPGFFGSNVHEAVLKAGEKETGFTIHFVDNNVDAGEIIIQKKVEVDSRDTPDTLKEKVQALEKKWYPEVIRQIAERNKEKQNS